MLGLIRRKTCESDVSEFEKSIRKEALQRAALFMSKYLDVNGKLVNSLVSESVLNSVQARYLINKEKSLFDRANSLVQIILTVPERLNEFMHCLKDDEQGHIVQYIISISTPRTRRVNHEDFTYVEHNRNALQKTQTAFLSQIQDNQLYKSKVDSLYAILLRRCHKLEEFIRCIKVENESFAQSLSQVQNDTFNSATNFYLPENYELLVIKNKRTIIKNSKNLFYHLDVNRFLLNNILHKGLVSREDVEYILTRGLFYRAIELYKIMKKESSDLSGFIDCFNVDYQHHISTILLNNHCESKEESVETESYIQNLYEKRSGLRKVFYEITCLLNPSQELIQDLILLHVLNVYHKEEIQLKQKPKEKADVLLQILLRRCHQIESFISCLHKHKLANLAFRIMKSIKLSSTDRKLGILLEESEI
ncbi:DgyrCDS10238 [Dimorphilus gyrociliatus]|uniref:DgyrCDS10238 n=1 Tax=Dimorphilus gyrociliatus TaxID=2664684 RepID=A0A7I8VZU0_9ANNE|nr:DgyrCDS10238 [Dimorphilus gyrociliatus]